MIQPFLLQFFPTSLAPTAFPSPMVVGFVIAGVIIAGIFCYCCVARCRRKKRYSNRSRAVPQTAAAPPVYHHVSISFNRLSDCMFLVCIAVLNLISSSRPKRQAPVTLSHVLQISLTSQ